jgi:hypothetical protein
MAEVSYFQRYSQRENHVTNNTLLVLRHLYQTGPAKLEGVLRELLGDDKIALGPSFSQQIKRPHSVPDALIAQAPFHIYFETKMGQALDLPQLKRHIGSIAENRGSEDAKSILIGLSTAQMLTRDEDTVASYGRDRGVVFKSVTFAGLAEAVRAACADYESGLRAVVLDYVAFLSAEGLLYASEDWMLVVPCGTSYAENLQFGVYYDGADRPARSPCGFLGIYKDKCISLVGAIKAVLVCQYEADHVSVEHVERGASDAGMLGRIKGIIEATGYYDLKAEPQRYYVVDRFEPTDLARCRKARSGELSISRSVQSSARPMWRSSAHRNLQNICGESLSRRATHRAVRITRATHHSLSAFPRPLHPLRRVDPQ